MTSATMYTANLRERNGGAAQTGFTLIELLITLAILGVLTAVAVPGFKGFIAGQQVRSASFDITAALIQARSEAIKRNVQVSVTPVSSAWTNGWTVSSTSVAGNLAQHEAFPIGLVITGPSVVTYNGNGRLDSAVTDFNISRSGTVRTATIGIDTSGLPKSRVAN